MTLSTVRAARLRPDQAAQEQHASDRTSCRSALANQVRLVLHTPAYGLMLTLRNAIPKQQPLAHTEFAGLRPRLIKIGARITKTAARVRIALATACPEAGMFSGIARSLQPAGPGRKGQRPSTSPVPQPSTLAAAALTRDAERKPQTRPPLRGHWKPYTVE